MSRAVHTWTIGLEVVDVHEILLCPREVEHVLDEGRIISAAYLATVLHVAVNAELANRESLLMTAGEVGEELEASETA